MITTVISDLNTIINGLNVPVGNLGLTRSQMPQFDSQDKLTKALNSSGIKFTIDSTKLADLRLTQSEINKTKVFKLMRKIKSNGTNSMPPIVVSNDGYVLDGSHRFVAKYNRSKKGSIPTITVDSSALDFISLVKNNSASFGATYRNLSDSTLSK